MCGIVMTILFICERFLTCKYCTYTLGSLKFSSFNFYLLIDCYLRAPTHNLLLERRKINPKLKIIWT